MQTMVVQGSSISKQVQGISTSQLATQFRMAAKSYFSGKFNFSSADGKEWSLYFRLGRLIWTASSEHRFRRWYRLLKQFCPTIHPQSIKLPDNEIPFHWEYLVLSVLFKRQHIQREQAIALIQAITREVLFDLLYTSEDITESSYAHDKQEELNDPLAPFNAEQLLAQVQQDLNNWSSAGLSHYSPNAVPVIKRSDELKKCVSAKTYQTLKTLINGELTLRDLSRATGQELISLTRVLAPLFQRDIIGLSRLPDFPTPTSSVKQTDEQTALAASPDTEAPLIVCIDDSPQVCKAMKRIMESGGYRYLSVQDSVHALPLLLEKKPSLIFLDLVMPIASGYEICSQIRRISVFKDIPIVILTGKDGIVDRVRAKVVGASDFLAKPVDPAKVLSIARQYLPSTSSVADQLANHLNSQFHPMDDSYDIGETTALLIQESVDRSESL